MLTLVEHCKSSRHKHQGGQPRHCGTRPDDDCRANPRKVCSLTSHREFHSRANPFEARENQERNAKLNAPGFAHKQKDSWHERQQSNCKPKPVKKQVRAQKYKAHNRIKKRQTNHDCFSWESDLSEGTGAGRIAA